MADGNGTDAPPHRAIPLGTLDSFNGLSKNRVFEWHIKEYAVTRNKEPKTILQGIGACMPMPVWSDPSPLLKPLTFERTRAPYLHAQTQPTAKLDH